MKVEPEKLPVVVNMVAGTRVEPGRCVQAGNMVAGMKVEPERLPAVVNTAAGMKVEPGKYVPVGVISRAVE